MQGKTLPEDPGRQYLRDKLKVLTEHLKERFLTEGEVAAYGELVVIALTRYCGELFQPPASLPPIRAVNPGEHLRYTVQALTQSVNGPFPKRTIAMRGEALFLSLRAYCGDDVFQPNKPAGPHEGQQSPNKAARPPKGR